MRRPALGYILTIAQWLPEVTRRDLRGDLVAGLTVGVMLVPQSMAYAVLAGVPPSYGLYASLVPLLVYPLVGTSRHLAVGTIAIDMLIVSAGLGALATPGSEAYIALAVLLALLVGAVQFAMGLARLGFVVNLLSRPVIAGFTSAAALIIMASQLGNLLGLDLPASQHIYTLVWEAAGRIGSVESAALLVGAISLFVLVAAKRWAPLFPAPLLVVVLGIGAAWLGLEGEGLAVVGPVPTGLPPFEWPAVSLEAVRSLAPTALTLALVQFMSIVSLGKVFAARHRYSIRANRELAAVGLANMAGSLFRGIPISGSFSRTAVNAQAGARTPLANVVAAALVALALVALTPLFAHLPYAALGAIIVVSAFGLFDVPELRYLLRAKRVDGGIALLTFATTLLVGIQEGLLVGIGASVVAVMYRLSRPNVAELGHLPGTRSFRDLARHAEAERLEGLLLLRIDASFSFANAEFLKDLLLRKSEPEDHPIRAVVIDASSINDLDTTAAAVLAATAETLEARGVELYFGGLKEPVRDLMVRSGLFDALGPDRFFLSPHRAVRHLLEARGEAADYLETVPGAEAETDEHAAG